MNIKKYNEFLIKENEEVKEKTKEEEEIPFDDKKDIEDEDLDDAENNLDDAETSIDDNDDIDGESDIKDAEDDLDDAETSIDDEDYDDESSEFETPEYKNYDSFEKDEDEISNESVEGCKIVIINGCEPDSEIDKKTEEFKSKCGGECKEIHLYQLNIQAPKKQEPKDGMVQIYEALESASAIVFACQVNKNKLSDSLEMAIARIKNYFKKEELKNKIFGAIVIGNEEKIKDSLILTAVNDLHMVVCVDCLFFGEKSSNISKMVDSITTLANATSLIKNTDKEKVEIKDDLDDDDLDDEKDEFVDSLKHMSNLGMEDKTEEEEDRVIDNENGTITMIQHNDEVTEKMGKILPFDKFLK